MDTEPTVSVEQFGKDHWSTLVYIESRAVDQRGILNHDQMRCNIQRHAYLVGPQKMRHLSGREEEALWNPRYGTVLRDGSMRPEHDDWDCLYDLVEAGLAEIAGSHATKHIDSVIVRLTLKGVQLAQQVRLFKAQGGQYRDFLPK